MSFKLFLSHFFIILFSSVCIAEADSSYAVKKWQFVDFGENIGSANILNYDIDKDGTNEIFLNSGNYDKNHLRILKYKNNDYISFWISKNYGDKNIVEFTIKDVDSDSTDDLIVILNDGTIELYDLTTLKIKSSHLTSASNPSAVEISDINKDGILEYIFVKDDYYYGSKYLKIINSVTYAEEYNSTTLTSSDVKAGDVDKDGTIEIVLSTGKILNGITREIEWEYTGGFGSRIVLNDIDQDSVKEIVAISSAYYITAYDAQFKTPLWQINTGNDLQSILVSDFNGDGSPEIIVGNNQWGDILCYKSSDRKILWNFDNPLSGCTNILIADVDGDGSKELMWGGGQNSTGADIFYVADPSLKKIEWQSKDLDGPYFISSYNIDNDEQTELVAASHSSNSSYDGSVLLVFDSENYNIEFTYEIDSWYGLNSLCADNLDDQNSGDIIYGLENILYIKDGITNEKLFQYNFPSSAYISSIKVKDIDNDKVKEIIVGDQQGYITIFDSKTFNQEWQSIKTGGSIGQIVVGNCDDDESDEIIFFNRYGYIQVYDGTTHYLEWQENTLTDISALALADVDMNGNKEIIVGFNKGKIVLLDSQTHKVKSEYQVGSEAIKGITAANLDDSYGYEVVVGTSRIIVFKGIDFTKKWESEPLGWVGSSDNIFVKDIDNDGYNDILASGSWGIFHFEVNSKYPDVTPPYVKFHRPFKGQIKVGIDSKIELIFSEKIDSSGINDNIIIYDGNTQKVPYSFAYDDSLNLTLMPDSLLSAEDTIKIIIKNKLSDIAGNLFDGNKNGISEIDSIDNYVFSFITGSGIDTVGPVFANITCPDTIWRGTHAVIKASASDFSTISTTSLKYAEYFIDSLSAYGAGIPLISDDGEINSVQEQFTIDLNTENWKYGEHYIFFVAKDVKENWSEPHKIKIIIKYENPSNWVTNGYNTQHTGFNEGDSISSSLSLAVSKNFPIKKIGAFTVVDDKVIFTVTDYNSKKVFCLRTDNGDEIWSKDFGGIHSCNPSSFAYGNLYLQVCNNEGRTFLYCLKLNTGDEIWRSPFGAQWETYFAPAISDGKVFINGGTYGGIYAFDAFTGERLWFCNLGQYDKWSPAVFDNTVYAFVDGKISAFEQNTGRIIWEKALQFQWNGWSMNTSPVIDAETNTILVTSRQYLHAIDLNSREVKWMKTGIFNLTPALYNKQVFAIKDNRLIVYDINKGDTLWSFKGKTNFSQSPVISNGLVFLSSATETYAVKIDDHKSVWKYSKGGEIVVSNNKLFIGTDSGYVFIFEKGTTDIAEISNQLPETYKLMQNYPNPFNPSTTIEYQLPEASGIKIQIYNMMGELVETLADQYQSAGYHKIVWNANDYSSGVYFCRIFAEGEKSKFTETKKMVYLK